MLGRIKSGVHRSSHLVDVLVAVAVPEIFRNLEQKADAVFTTLIAVTTLLIATHWAGDVACAAVTNSSVNLRNVKQRIVNVIYRLHSCHIWQSAFTQPNKSNRFFILISFFFSRTKLLHVFKREICKRRGCVVDWAVLSCSQGEMPWKPQG
jgi:hypothetical protein